MRYRIGTSIRDLDQGVWDALAGGQVMLSHSWLRCTEEMDRRSHRRLYAPVEDEAGPLAAIAAPYLDRIEPLQALSGTAAAEGLARLVLLLTVPFYGESKGLALRPRLALADALPRLEPVLEEICRGQRRFILAVGNVSSEDIPVWRRASFLAQEQPPGAVLRLPEDYAAYLHTLGGHERRELARMRRRAREAGTEFARRASFQDDGRLYDLLCERYRRHGVDAGQLDLRPEMLSCLRLHFPQNLMLFTASVGGALAGWVLALVREDKLFLLFSGYRYALSMPNFVYFLLYDEAIRWSLSRGIRTIDAGTTMLEVKARQGFLPIRRWVCWRATAQPVNAALKTFERPINVLLSRAWSLLGRSRASTLAILALVALLGPAKAGSAPETDRRVVDSFSGRTEPDGRPWGWESLVFRNRPRRTSYTVESDGDDYYVKAVSSAAVSAIVKRVRLDLKSYPLLSWRWKIEGVLKSADVLHKSGDDCAARVYVGFVYDPKRAGPWQRLRYDAAKLLYGHYPPQAVLNYIWDNRLPQGTSLDNAHSDRSKMIVVESGNEKAGRWVSEERDVYADYEKLFGGPPPTLDFVALMTDTDNTGESAVAYFDDIAFKR